MKIEKINDNQIKCTLNKSDLASREIKISELAYGTDKAKDLFRDMMQQASYEFGFEAEDIPLMIEAIPVSSDCIVLLITKVEDPEELDTRFSKFAPSIEDSEDNDDFDDTEGSNDVLDIISDMTNFISKIKDSVSNSTVSEDTSAKENSETNREIFTRCYSFSKLDDVISACEYASGLFNEKSSLYKTPDSKYYLIFTASQRTPELISMCNIFSEYSEKVKITFFSEAYFAEHYECIISENAIQKLSKL